MNEFDLPIYRTQAEFLTKLAQHHVVIVESPTGSGKTTQLPLILHRHGYTKNGCVAVTQPRRLATLSIYEYLRQKLTGEDEGVVGYKIRFAEDLGPKTRLQIVTDGTLLQEMKRDPLLRHYAVIMIDEAHERSLNIDLLLGLIKRLLPQRPDLKVIISSATLDSLNFSRYFGGAPVISVKHKIFPVRTVYHPLDLKYLPGMYGQKVSKIIEHILLEKTTDGDILVFMSGVREIFDLITNLEKSDLTGNCLLMPLYARLSSEEQMRIFEPTPRGKTKIVVATNIAETSVTIDNVTVVVDSGKARFHSFDPKTYSFALHEGPISKASCTQRMGRAGRTRPGVCYRLYSCKDMMQRPEYTQEEILRTELSEVVLRMADLNIVNFDEFPFLLAPGKLSLRAAVKTLQHLEALDERQRITSLGRRMSSFPLLPRHGRIILEAMLRYPQVTEQVAVICAFLSTNPPFLIPQGEETEARLAHQSFAPGNNKYGDFAAFLNLYQRYLRSGDQEKFCRCNFLDPRVMHEVFSITHQLKSLIAAMGVPVEGGLSMNDQVLICCARGFVHHICVQKRQGLYQSLNVFGIVISPGSAMFRKDAPVIVAAEIIKTSRTYARVVSPLPVQLLDVIEPGLKAKLLGLNTADNSKGKQVRVSVAEELSQVRKLLRSNDSGSLLRLDWLHLRTHAELLKRHYDSLPRGQANLVLRRRVMFARLEICELIEIALLVDPEQIQTELPAEFISGHDLNSVNLLLAKMDTFFALYSHPKRKGRSRIHFVGLAEHSRDCYRFCYAADFGLIREQTFANLANLCRCLADFTSAEKLSNRVQHLQVRQGIEQLRQRSYLNLSAAGL